MSERQDLDAGLKQDFASLASRTTEATPTLAQVALSARLSQRNHPWRTRIMTTTRKYPALATAAVVVALAFGLLLVPISYQRTIGHEARVAIAGGVGVADVGALANGLKSVLGAESVEAALNGGAVTLTARVPGRSNAQVAAVANAFARSLAARGYTATTTVTPITERVSDNVYALARDQTIRADGANKSRAEIAAEVRRKLADAGLPNAQVSVTETTLEGKPGKMITIDAGK